VTPPESTAAFFSGMPPKQTTSCVWATITGHDVPRWIRSSCVPITCGRITRDAPRL
jgi:hypothetical protein